MNNNQILETIKNKREIVNDFQTEIDQLLVELSVNNSKFNYGDKIKSTMSGNVFVFSDFTSWEHKPSNGHVYGFKAKKNGEPSKQRTYLGSQASFELVK